MSTVEESSLHTPVEAKDPDFWPHKQGMQLPKTFKMQKKQKGSSLSTAASTRRDTESSKFEGAVKARRPLKKKWGENRNKACGIYRGVPKSPRFSPTRRRPNPSARGKEQLKLSKPKRSMSHL
jgi:hypothetical protein